jgi:cellulose synthase/poly-beta-1,6-N-acetylglucosamine synthase-like glycosyltransferase
MSVLSGATLIIAVFVVYLAICLIFLTKSTETCFPSDESQALPTVSIVVPTFNEEGTILEKLNNLMLLDYPFDRLEIVVVDSSDDNTPKLIAEYRSKFPLRFIREQMRKGEATALNIGYLSSKGQIIVKSDCDATSEDPAALKNLVRHFKDPHIGGVSCVYVDSYQMPTEGAYRGLLTRLQVGESRIDSTMIAHGPFMGFRRELLEPISPESAADDTELFVKIRRKGYRCIIDDQIRFREIRPPDARMVIHQRARRAYGIIKVVLSNIDILFNPHYGAYGLIVFPSNLFMLVVSPSLLGIGTILFAAGLFQEGLLGGLAAGISLAAFSLSLKYEKPRLFTAFIHTQLAALVGLLMFLSKKPKHVWKKDR